MHKSPHLIACLLFLSSACGLRAYETSQAEEPRAPCIGCDAPELGEIGAGFETDDPNAIPSGGCVDFDQDGFFTCLDPDFPERKQIVDCNDGTFTAQPGGVEFEGNGIDDDCDGDIDEPLDCGCEPSGEAGLGAIASALGACDGWLDDIWVTGAPAQFGVFERYHNVIEGRNGDECMAAISTGDVDSANVNYGPVQTGCEYVDPSPESGDTEGGWICDLAQVHVRLKRPANAMGLEFDFMFMSAEWPEYLCSNFNDTFYTLYNSDCVTGGVPRNIAFDSEEDEITVNAGFFESPEEWTVPLGETPFGEPDVWASCAAYGDPFTCQLPSYCVDEGTTAFRGSGSGWLVTRAPAHIADEYVELTFSIHDEGDGVLDSVALLDGFKWLPHTPTLGTTKVD